MIAIVLGLSSAALYGSADFIGGMAAKRAAVLCVTAVSQSVGLIVLLAMLPFFPGRAAQGDWGWGLAGGVCGGIGISLLYHALSIGKMGVVSPVTAVVAAALPVGVGILRGDPLRWFQLAGIAAAMLAVVTISFSKEESGEREIATSGLKEAILAGVAIGGFFIVLGLSRPSAGLSTLLAARIGSVAFLLLLAAATRTSLRTGGKTFAMLALTGAIDMSANAMYVVAAQTGELAIASVLASLYPASTVFLARAVLKERLQFVQRIGVALALVGVALIAA